MATVGERHEEFIRFWDSVKENRILFELIIVDQTGNLKELVSKVEDNRIVYCKVNFKGLSRARNHGIQLAKGEILCFPDDDCWFPEHLLEIVNKKLRSNNLQGIVGRIFDPLKNREVNRRIWPKSEFDYDISNIYIGSSISMFFQKEVLENVNGFDDNFGIAGRYGACEETDLLMRVIKNKYKISYSPDIILYHPYFNTSYSKQRAYTYGLGFGAFTKKCIIEKKLASVMIYYFKKLFTATVKSIVFSLARPKVAMYYYFHLKGLLKGYLSYR